MLFNTKQISDITGKSKKTIESWKKKGFIYSKNGSEFELDDLAHIPEFSYLFSKNKYKENTKPQERRFRSIELFAGAGGLALGLEQAGFEHLLLNELDKSAAKTLTINRPNWNIQHCSITDLKNDHIKGVDLISGGVPCQSFSHHGKRLGFNDTRGTMVYEFFKVIRKYKPKCILIENVKGLISHDKGMTMNIILGIMNEIGYPNPTYHLMNSLHYKVAQKRERVFIIGIREDLKETFATPVPYPRFLTLKDALKPGELYKEACPISRHAKYSRDIAEIYEQIPQGGNWKDLPSHLSNRLLGNSNRKAGGYTGVGKRLSWDQPSPTLTCSPIQRQTGRCHPKETRPLSVREYARIQGFPDDWEFEGNLSSQYKQIGNAVPPNLAMSVGHSIRDILTKAEAQ